MQLEIPRRYLPEKVKLLNMMKNSMSLHLLKKVNTVFNEKIKIFIPENIEERRCSR
jgi:hypothetical protein